jgi:hypothetical protein
MAGTDSTPDSRPAQVAAQEAAHEAAAAQDAATRAKMREVQEQGYVDLNTPMETEQESEATTPQTEAEAPATGGVDWDFLQAASKEQYEEYVDGLTSEQAKELARGLPIAGVRSFSKSKNEVIAQGEALALTQQEYQQELLKLAGQFAPQVPAPSPPAPEDGWVDPTVADLKQKVAQMEARDQQRQIAEGLGLVGEQMHGLAEQHPFFAEMGAVGAQRLFNHMGQLNTGNVRLAFKDLFEAELDSEKEERIVARVRGQKDKVASVPHMAPSGGSRRVPSELPRTIAGKKEQMKKLGIGQRLKDVFKV